MPVNLDKPQKWKADIALSVDMFNDWFMRFAPQVFRETRTKVTSDVEATLRLTANLSNVSPDSLRVHPEVLPTLRMSTCPPIAVDRLIGLAGVSRNLVGSMEKGKLPARTEARALDGELGKICAIIARLVDPDIFAWLGRRDAPSDGERHRAATIVADRLCGAVANPIMRNAQEKRQLTAIATWLRARGYKRTLDRTKFDRMEPGTFSFRMNVPITHRGGARVNIPIDVAVLPLRAKRGELPVLIEAKSAGDFTNVNKRRKEEATKVSQLRSTYGAGTGLNLFLCGYFDTGYLGYEAAEGIDWIWEHRIDELAELGL